MILSLDISTSCIGYAVFSLETSELVKLGCFKMDSKDSLFERMNQFKAHIKELQLLDIKYIAVEEPLKKFKGKFSSADTIAKLNFFNGMISSMCSLMFSIEPVYYNVQTARKLSFPNHKFTSNEESGSSKQQVWELVKNLEPHLNWRYGPKSRKLLDENFDMCDAYIVGLAHMVILESQNS